MKVLFVSGADGKYGAPKALMGLIETLTEKHRIEAVVLTKKHNEVNDWCDSRGIENYSFWYRDIMSASAYRNPILNVCKHCVKFSGYLWGGITQHFILARYPALAEVDLIHTNLNRLDIGSYIAEKRHIPHVCHLRELRSGHSRIIAYTPGAEKKMSHRADRFIAISGITRKNWIMSGLPEDRIELIYNGIAVEKYSPTEQTGFERLKIVCTGRIEENKGQAQIIEAAGRLPQTVRDRTELIFIGEAYSEYKAYLMKLIAGYGLEEKVSFKGYCSNVAEIIRDCNIGITCSKGEAFGRVTVEYMAGGLLAVACNTGANEEIVTHMQTGLIYRYGDADDLSRKLKFIYENPSVCRRIIQESRKAAGNFSQDKNAEEIYKVYRKLIVEHSG